MYVNMCTLVHEYQFENSNFDECYIHSCQLLQIFSNYYKFFQELWKYELLFKNYEFQVFHPMKK